MWFRLVSAACGVWLMAAPAVLDYGEPASINDRVVGPIIAAVAVIAIWEATRDLRRVNTLMGAWLLIAPWLLGYEGAPILNSIVIGMIVFGMSFVRGKVEKRVGGGWTAIFKPPTYDEPSKPPRTETQDLKVLKQETRQLQQTLEQTQQSIKLPERREQDMENKPEVVVITGASAGVGRATARAFARQGARIGLIARNEERLEAARQEIEAMGGEALVLPTDVSYAEQVEAAAQAVEDTFGPIDIWVNNAMVSVFSPIKEMQPEEFRRVTEVTYLGYVYGTLSALKRMLPRDKGMIVQVGSALAYRGIPLQSAYCGAKHAIEGFTDSLRVELLHDKSNVKVTMVQMPALNTPQFRWVKSRLPNKAQPVPPIFEPELAAEAIVYAAHHPRRELIVGGPALQAIVLNKFFPGIADRYLAKSGYKSQQTSQPRDEDRPHNLWSSVPGNQGARGVFEDKSRRTSLQYWVATNRKLVSAAVGGVAVLLTGIVAAIRGTD